MRLHPASNPDGSLDVLLATEHPIWPANHGVSLRGYHLLKALHELNVSVRVTCLRPGTEELPDDIRAGHLPWPQPATEDVALMMRGWGGPLRALRHKVIAHQDLHPAQLAGLATLVRQYRPAAVLGLGLHSPMMLKGLTGLRATTGSCPALVWYAADEMMLFHASCLMREPMSHWPRRGRELVLHGLIERLFVPGLDGAIGVSPRDSHCLRVLAGARQTVVARNGVDLDYFQPAGHLPAARSVIFWGRLDFTPNADAMRWFAREVWPGIVATRPEAKCIVLGPGGAELAEALRGQAGVEVVGEVADIRPWVRQAGAVVLPMRCGAGIKNKLLEAAALGKPILASARAVEGLEPGRHDRPWIVCASVAEWQASIRRVWADSAWAVSLGQQARQWVQTHHTWRQAGEVVRDFLSRLTGRALGERHSPDISQRRAA